MVSTKLDVNIRSFLAQVEQMIRNGEIELRTEKEKNAHKIARVRYVDEQGIQVIVGKLYSRPFVPHKDTKKQDILDEIIHDFRELAAKLEE
jgi:hypothetical protein